MEHSDSSNNDAKDEPGDGTYATSMGAEYWGHQYSAPIDLAASTLYNFYAYMFELF